MFGVEAKNARPGRGVGKSLGQAAVVYICAVTGGYPSIYHCGREELAERRFDVRVSLKLKDVGYSSRVVMSESILHVVVGVVPYVAI